MGSRGTPVALLRSCRSRSAHRDLRFTGLVELVLRSFLLCIDRLADIESAAEAYRRLDGILYAESNGRAGDGSDIAVEGKRRVVCRLPGGAGDFRQVASTRTRFFVAEGTGVREVDWGSALSDPVLRRLAKPGVPGASMMQRRPLISQAGAEDLRGWSSECRLQPAIRPRGT
jgi:hypothetical protein